MSVNLRMSVCVCVHWSVQSRSKSIKFWVCVSLALALVIWVEWCSFDVITFPCSLFCCFCDCYSHTVRRCCSRCFFVAIKIHKHLFDSYRQKACQFTLERHRTLNTYCKWQLTVCVSVCNRVHSVVQWKLDFMSWLGGDGILSMTFFVCLCARCSHPPNRIKSRWLVCNSLRECVCVRCAMRARGSKSIHKWSTNHNKCQ